MTGTISPTKTLLPVRETFCDGQMVCRFLRPLDLSESVILAIPGGPGLSNHYLDPFMFALAERTKANVAIMDLPNHGASIIKEVTSPLSYLECRDLVKRTTAEILGKAKSLVLFGQSFGARLAFDLLAELEKAPQVTLLTGFPYIFEISSALLVRLNDLPLEPEEGPRAEEIHAENWRKILPIYTAQPLPKNVSDALASKEKVLDGHRMLQDAPPIQEVAKAIKTTAPLLVIEAQLDPVVPDNNWDVLRSLLPHATFSKIENVGHFPMAEKPEEVLSAFSEMIERSRKSVG